MATGRDQGAQPVNANDDLETDSSQTPPQKTHIKKLKAFFGERTPKIMEATEKKGDLPSPLHEVVREGILQVKTAVTDGKKSSDRSWKPMWAQLRGHALYLQKDRKENASPLGLEEQPISIKSSLVDIAYDYTKKKHVFRLTTYNGSEYLFQVEDHDTMMDWIQKIQEHNDPDNDQGAGNTDLILRKSSQIEQQAATVKSSPQVAPKSAGKKLTVKTSKAPHSPSMKHRRAEDSPKNKENKSWRGRMAKGLKRFGSGTSTNVEAEAEEAVGTFGVPLELCPASSNNEYLPMVIEICTSIVEARGLEFVGIYRVPGNTAAVATLQEELNKGSPNPDNEKWLDVNVVGSLLKSFFRKLPESLVTDELYQAFIDANRLENPEKRMLILKKLLHDLPEHHFETFNYLAQHLKKVASYGHVNKMDARNLAIVFGPTLVRTTDESMYSLVTDMSDQCRIVETIIQHNQWMFSDWEEDTHVPLDEEPVDANPVTSMNTLLTKIARSEETVLPQPESKPPSRHLPSFNLRLLDGREISAKDLVSNIIQAANKRVKRKDKKSSSDSSDIGSECGFNERNIDEAVVARQLKMQGQPTERVESGGQKDSVFSTKTDYVDSRSKSEDRGLDQKTSEVNLLGRCSTEVSLSSVGSRGQSSLDSHQPPPTTTTTVTSVSSQEQQRIDSGSTRQAQKIAPVSSYSDDLDLQRQQVTEKQAFQRTFNTIYTHNRPSITRPRSEESLLDSRLDHDEVEITHGYKKPSVSHEERKRRLEFEARAMRQKEEERQREKEKRELERQRIEVELQKTQRELDEESKDSSLEDLLKHAQPGDITNKISDYSNKLADLSNKADTTSITSDYSTTSSATYTAFENQRAPPPHQTSDYSSNTSPTSLHADAKLSLVDPEHSRPLRSNMPTVQSDGRPAFGGSKVYAVTVSRSAHPGHLRRSHTTDLGSGIARIHLSQHPAQPQHASSRTITLRRASVENEPRHKPPPHDGYTRKRRSRELEPYPHDLNTVDHSRAQHRRGSLDSLRDYYDRHDVRHSVSSASEDGNSSAPLEDRLKALLVPGSSDYTRFPSSIHDSNRINVQDNIRDKSSGRLDNKRPEKTETKIGIASRFERNPPPTSDRTENTAVSSGGAPEGNNTQTIPPSHQVMPMTKFEKTGSNLSQQAAQGGRDTVQGRLRKAGSLDHLEIDAHSAEKVSSPERTEQSPKSEVSEEGPKVKRRTGVDKKLRRRHTVGGVKDVDHFRAIVTSLGQSEPSKQSAWERLQPRDRDTGEEDDRNLQTWLARERLRTSATDLTAGLAKALVDINLSTGERGGERPLQTDIARREQKRYRQHHNTVATAPVESKI
ncbi:rho GTPase-activating protein 21 isoform X1 [Lingula anatina]|uniref:Rho GTPase-activating protein 21 isoform X1 n=1 Tax=Lingula anatina TaxID=7574 RepID=A0A2R2MPW5_LINAN|nr:rho GTPase-activating protein 21 isoform X1 [Lingula anatina]|eukprot:XP_023932057.1 rho GTPase-activating protein 21 isoform X1 [Lingula anatina]